MQTELVPAPAQPIAQLAHEVTPMVLIERAMERGIDPGQLYDLARKWQEDMAAEGFAKALATFQAKCPKVEKKRTIDLGHGKSVPFANLEDVMDAIKQLLCDCGLAVTFSAGVNDAGMLTAKCMIHHGRHVEHSEITVPVPKNMSVNDTQKTGAALSYAKRYALCAALNIVISDEDTDGEGLHETITEEQADTLRQWIETTNSNEKKFLEVAGATSLALIKAKDFDRLFKMLQQKAKR